MAKISYGANQETRQIVYGRFLESERRGFLNRSEENLFKYPGLTIKINSSLAILRDPVFIELGGNFEENELKNKFKQLMRSLSLEDLI